MWFPICPLQQEIFFAQETWQPLSSTKKRALNTKEAAMKDKYQNIVKSLSKEFAEEIRKTLLTIIFHVEFRMNHHMT